MRILHTVEHYTPFTCGMAEVVRQLSERLAALGHKITVATSIHPKRNFSTLNQVKIESFNISGCAATGFGGTSTEIRRYKEFILNENFDIITNFAAQQWATDLCFDILPSLRKTKLVLVPTGFSGLKNRRFKDYFKQIPHKLSYYDKLVFLSQTYQDIEFVQQHNIDKNKICVIPNGCARDEFFNNPMVDINKKFNLNDNSFVVLLVGSHTNCKGHYEAMKIFTRASIPNSKLIIIGNWLPDIKHCSALKIFLRNLKHMLLAFSPNCHHGCNYCSSPEKINKDIIVTTLSREETICCYHRANLFLLPSNIECSPIVLFEAMASRTPWLCTDVGNAAELAEITQSGLIMPTYKYFWSSGLSFPDIKGAAKQLRKLALDKTKLDTMANNGYHAWKNNFTWELIATKYEQMYHDLLNQQDNTSV